MQYLNLSGVRGDDFNYSIRLLNNTGLYLDLSGQDIQFNLKYGSFNALNKYIESDNILDSGNINLVISGNSWNDVLPGEYDYCIQVSGKNIYTPIIGKFNLIDDILF